MAFFLSKPNDELNRVPSKTVPYIGAVYHEYDIIDGVETGETAERTIEPKGNVTTKIYDRAGWSINSW